MNEVNEIKEPSTETNQKPDLIGRFAEVNGISREEATNLIGGENEEEILKNIEQYTIARINEKMPKLNREQRRKLAKKKGKQATANKEIVFDTAKKLNYINLIQGLRKLNEKKEKEENEDTNQDN